MVDPRAVTELTPPSLTFILHRGVNIKSTARITRNTGINRTKRLGDDVLQAYVSPILVLRTTALGRFEALRSNARLHTRISIQDPTHKNTHVPRNHQSYAQNNRNQRRTQQKKRAYCLTAVYKSTAPSGKTATMSSGR